MHHPCCSTQLRRSIVLAVNPDMATHTGTACVTSRVAQACILPTRLVLHRSGGRDAGDPDTGLLNGCAQTHTWWLEGVNTAPGNAQLVGIVTSGVAAWVLYGELTNSMVA